MGASHTSGLTNRHRVNQLFFLGKCSGPANNSDAFYKWCEDPPIGQHFNATCRHIEEASGTECQFDLAFLKEGKELVDKEMCWMGSKWQISERTHKLTEPEDLFYRIQTSCHYWRLGRPLPWWVILLIVLAIVIVLSIAAALIWTYWLKERWYRRQGGAAGSTITSRWTSTPVSSTSSSAYSNASSAPGAARASSRAPSRMPSTQPSTQPVFGGSVSQRPYSYASPSAAPGSMGSMRTGSLQPSVRSSNSSSGRRQGPSQV
jgi:hypothetical protein